MPYSIEMPNGKPVGVVDTFRDVVNTVIDWPGCGGVVWYDSLDRPVGPEGQPQGAFMAVVWVGPVNPKRAVVARSRFLTVN